MAATQFYWLSDSDANTLIIDQNFLTLKIGETTRKLKLDEYAGRSGGIVRGFGLLKHKIITFGRREKLTGDNESAFNTARLAFQKWAVKSRTTTVYFNIKVSDTGDAYQAVCVPTSAGADNYPRNYAVTDQRTFSVIVPGGAYYDTVADTQNYTYTVADATQNFTVSNTGIINVFPKIKFTPTNAATYLDVKTADNFGVRLQKTSFLAGSQIIYDTADNSLTFGGVTQATRQFLTSGSSFFLKEGNNTIYITSDSIGSATIEWNEGIV